MKKQLIGILATLACFACLGACGKGKGNDDSSSDSSDAGVAINLNAAKEILKSMYFQDAYVENNVDYKYVTSLSNVAGVDYTIEWSVDVTEGVVLINQGETVLIDVDEAAFEPIEYVLTAKIVAPDGTSIEQQFRRTVKALDKYVIASIKGKPAENTEYKLHVYQASLGKDLYFAGDMNGYYFATTESSEEAVDIYAEYVTGSETNFNLYFMKDEVKQYIGMRVSADGAHNNIVFDTAPVSEFYWSGEYSAMVTKIVDRNGKEAEFFLGNYSTLKTISGSYVSYIAEGNNVGGLVGLVDRTTVADADKVTDTVKTLSVAKAYVANDTVELAERGSMFPEVTITWACDSELVTIDGTNVTFANVEATTDVVLKATLTCGSETKTQEYTVKVVPCTAAALSEAAKAIGEGASFGNTATLTGVVTREYQAYDEKYGNVSVYVDFDGTEILCFQMKGSGADELAAGYTVTVTGIITNYKGNGQFASGCTIDSFVPGEAPEESSTPESSTPDSSEDDNDAVETIVAVTGAKLGIESEKYQTSEATAAVDGITFGFLQLGNYADSGLRFRTKDGVHGSLWNTTAFGGNITKVIFTLNAAKSAYDGNAYTIYLGNTAACNEKTMTVSTTANSVWEVAIEGNYTFIKIEHNNTYTQYWDSVEICFIGDASSNDSSEVESSEVDSSVVDSSVVEPAPEDSSVVEPAPENSSEDVSAPDSSVEESSTPDSSVEDSGNNETLSTPADIVNAAYALGENETLAGTYTLTGVIIVVDESYNSNYNNITVTIVVDGADANKPIKCYRMKGEGADTIAAGYTITVTGTLKNYYGTIEFDGGCTLDSYVYGEPPVQEGVELSFADAANRTSYSTSEQVWEQNGIKVTNNKSASTSNVGDYTNPARFYKSSSLTIEYAGMTKIEFVCNSASYASALQASITDANVTVTVEATKVIVEFNAPVDSWTIETMSAQVRVNSIFVQA